jgi:hypothetical protein
MVQLLSSRTQDTFESPRAAEPEVVLEVQPALCAEERVANEIWVIRDEIAQSSIQLTERCASYSMENKEQSRQLRESVCFIGAQLVKLERIQQLQALFDEVGDECLTASEITVILERAAELRPEKMGRQDG